MRPDIGGVRVPGRRGAVDDLGDAGGRGRGACRGGRALVDDDVGAAAGDGALAPGAAVLAEDRAQYPEPVPERVQVALAVDAGVLDAADLADAQPVGGRPNVDHGLDLETVAPQLAAVDRARQRRGRQMQGRDDPAPERVVAVAEVGEARPEQDVDHHVEAVVAQLAQRRDVVAVAAFGEARALDEVGTGDELGDEQRDLRGVGGAVGVDHHDDVAGAGGEPAGERVALTGTGLLHDDDVRPELPGHGDGPVDRPAVHHDHLGDAGRQLREDVWKVPFFIEGGNDDAYGR